MIVSLISEIPCIGIHSRSLQTQQNCLSTASDEPGKYIVEVIGFTRSGRQFMATTLIEVVH